MKRVRVLKRRPSSDTIKCCRVLLGEASDGDLIGMAYVGIHVHGNISVHYCGEAGKVPIITLGGVGVLRRRLEAMADAMLPSE